MARDRGGQAARLRAEGQRQARASGLRAGGRAPYGLVLERVLVGGRPRTRLALGDRREVTTLSWMLTSRHGGTDRIAVLRLRAIAAHRLALRGIDLYNAADAQRASELIGPSAHWLLATDQQVSPSHRQMVECVDAIERLDPELPSPNGRR